MFLLYVRCLSVVYFQFSLVVCVKVPHSSRLNRQRKARLSIGAVPNAATCVLFSTAISLSAGNQLGHGSVPTEGGGLQLRLLALPHPHFVLGEYDVRGGHVCATSELLTRSLHKHTVWYYTSGGVILKRLSITESNNRGAKTA